jgi:hypothetical protein
MSKRIAVVAIVVAATALMLIAPVLLFNLAMARPPLAAAANAYETNAPCAGPAAHGLPPPTRPLTQAARNGVPCAISGAMVTEKDTLTRGTGQTHYALGLRSDAGAEYLATLDGDSAADLWNSTQAGNRVLIQTFRGQVALVGDGTRTVGTVSNPSSAARSNWLSMLVAGGMCVLELLAAGLLVALRKRAAMADQSVDA